VKFDRFVEKLREKIMGWVIKINGVYICSLCGKDVDFQYSPNIVTSLVVCKSCQGVLHREGYQWT